MTRLEEIIVEHTKLAKEFVLLGIGENPRKEVIKLRIEKLRAERKELLDKTYLEPVKM